MFFDLSFYLLEFVLTAKNKGDVIVRINLGVYLKLSWHGNVILSYYLLDNILNTVILDLSRFCST